jgi:ACS family glucarate transporter-like MFS transporter
MGVLAFTFVLTVITYLDRVCISAAAPFIMKDLDLSVLQMSVVFSAFSLAYALLEVPSGWLGDVYGPRRVLARIVLWWSAFTMLTAAARGYASLVIIRFLFGAGEAGAFPNITRSFATWFPAHERGTANGVMFLGSRIGGMLSTPISLLLIAAWGWRLSFVAIGSIGIVWAVAWSVWYRDRPSEHAGVSPEELAWIQQDSQAAAPATTATTTPWRTLFTSRNLQMICLRHFTYGYGQYFYMTWLPTYLITELHFTLLRSGLFASLPFVLAGIANVVGGWLTDRLARAYGLRVARCWLGSASFLAAALIVIGSVMASDPAVKATLLALGLAAVDLALPACWAVCADVGKDHVGVISGCMNTFSQTGGLLAPLVVGFAVEYWQSWTFPFYVMALIYVVGAVAWLRIHPERPIVVPPTLVAV